MSMEGCACVCECVYNIKTTTDHWLFIVLYHTVWNYGVKIKIIFKKTKKTLDLDRNLDHF